MELEAVAKQTQPKILGKATGRPFVSVVIPCRNEEKYIADTLDSILRQSYPNTSFEILVIDGLSEDGTRRIVQEYSQRYPNIQLLDNPKLITPAAMNIGIRRSLGSLVVRMDAHCIYPEDYLEQLIDWISWLEADNVGAMLITEPAAETLEAQAVAIAMSHPFGVGNAYFRVGTKAPRLVDTVPFGCYRREVFERIGLFDEELARGQDNEFNSRLERAGGKIYLVPEIKIRYFPRINFAKTFRMYFQYGYCRPFVNIRLGKPATIRQFVPAVFQISLVLLALASLLDQRVSLILSAEIGLYLLACTFFSVRLAKRHRQAGLFPLLMFAFFGIHMAYGYGYLKASWETLILGRTQMDETRGAMITR